MISWHQIRFGLLVFTGCSLLIFLGKSIFFPHVANQESISKYTFPDRITLAGWEPLDSQPLNNKYPQPPKLVSSRVYQYRQQTITLTIEMRYTVEKGGNLIEFVKEYTPSQISSLGTAAREDRYQESTGFYTLFTSNNQAYLVSCINPRGSSTITAQQFNSNRYKYDLELPRLVSWLMGTENLRDLRCLWTQLSIPLQKLPQKKAYSLLESAWIEWYKWWYPHFPKV
ncbi:cyanoexosortase A system-associated protein [Merismopedia glauca]|uniref:Cyanoexosortase A system-associated protein n=1 Tax=Merismopedia glauca CCAP 1448/3 TaxID=1296344 RepID=A0A2T1C5F6_9CYAN|nr:cyanoexosortase A system-associated protein [Merismopedia glauca]PSB03512.1 cyanoexosortase A system-associated protein [Merismopedia glauca CCAP 1448/3]